MSAPRWEHPKSTGLQIAGGGGGGAPSTPAADIFAMLPKETAAAIQGSPQMGLMVGHQAGRQGLAGASYSQVNEFLMDQNFIDQPVTTAKGAKNPWNNTDVEWLEADYGTRNDTIAGLGKEESKYLKSFESAWLEETPVTTASAPTELTDKLTIA